VVYNGLYIQIGFTVYYSTAQSLVSCVVVSNGLYIQTDFTVYYSTAQSLVSLYTTVQPNL